jgi:hypothetical protein
MSKGVSKAGKKKKNL